MRNRGEKSAERIRQYPENVQRAADYIATNLAIADRRWRIAQLLPTGFRRVSENDVANQAQQRALGASEVLGILHTPPQAETWIEAIVHEAK